MSADKTYKISSLGIDTNAYVQRFSRNRHPVGDLKDKSYFGESERLTTAELKEIETWPDTVNDLFDRKRSKDAKDHFLRCSRGEVEPETSIERIITKLIHQALAMGGLHCPIGGDDTPDLHFPRDLPLNDIVDLKVLPLRSFLLGAKEEMAEYAKKEWERTWELALEQDMEIEMQDSEYLSELHESIQAEIRSDLASDAEGYLRSDDEGWFYDDDED